MTLPLPVAPARGSDPALSLGYSSNAGQGVFGYGWSVAIAHVGLDLRQGLPRYDGQDPVMLEGADRLVPMPGSGAENWTEDAVVAGVAYRITRHRPRIDPGLIRVERLMRLDTGVVHWRVADGNGGVTVYGQSAACRIADPLAPAHVFRWLAERSYDVAGNVTHYSYIAETGAAGGASPNLHLKRVSYGAATPYDPVTEVLPAFAYHTVFDHGDHHPDTPGLDPDRPAPVRPDPQVDRRPGFALETRRLCQQVILFHHFPELGLVPVPTRALRLTHQDQDGQSMLTAATMEAHDGAVRAAMPAVTFDYARFAHAQQIAPLTGPAGEDLLPGAGTGGQGANGIVRVWADIEGRGMPGILSSDGGRLGFARNLGAGRLGPVTPLGAAPAPGDPGRISVEAVDRDGRVALVLRTGPVQGFFPLDESGAAGPFVAFETVLNAGVPDAHLLVADWTGDGFADVLATDPSLLAQGEGPRGTGAFAQVAPGVVPGPVRNARDRAMLLADMTGDGLPDVVEVTSGAVRYWPGLGHGRFGPPVHMEAVPTLADAAAFDAGRVSLAALTGSGPADVIYARPDGVIYARNRGGMRYGPPHRIPADLGSPVRHVAVLDLLGSGVPAVVIASGLPGAAPRFGTVQPAGAIRSHLLVGAANGLGAAAQVSYGCSTGMAAEALAKGRPWRSTPPFGVMCVTQMQRTDLLRAHTVTERFAYAHAHYDPIEREFRGFARVESWDVSEADEAALRAGAVPADAALQPARYIRRWFDTGLAPEHPASAQAIEAEWWPGDAGVRAAAAPGLPPGAPAHTARRARQGFVLRTEQYQIDGTAADAIPVDIRTCTAQVIVLQPASLSRDAALRALPQEEVHTTHDRILTDPVVTQTLVLARDPLGLPVLAASVAYGRRMPDASLPPGVQADQARVLMDVAERSFTAESEGPNRRFLRRRPWRRRSWVVQGIAAPAARLLTAAEAANVYATAPEVAFSALTGVGAARRLTGETRDRYLGPDLATELADGTLGTLPIAARRYDLALTPDLQAAVWPAGFAAQVSVAGLGYVDLDGDGRWWVPNGRAIRGAGTRFLQPQAVEDVMGARVTLTYDPHALFVVDEADALGNHARVTVDYRTGQPQTALDANGTTVRLTFDTLGRVISRHVQGPAGEGDPAGDPGVIYTYDTDAFVRDGAPASQRSRTRENGGVGAAARWFERVVYFDGAGSALQLRERAAPGMANSLASGAVVAADTGTAPRWKVSARARLTNKGTPFAAYDPWFSPQDVYQDAPALVERGRTEVQFLDANGRVRRTVWPDGTHATATIAPWFNEVADRNDTILQSPAYMAAGAPDPAGPEPTDPQAHAIWQAARHAGTVVQSFTDAAGAVVYERHPLGNGTARTLRMTRSPGGHLTEAEDFAGRMITATASDLFGRPMRRSGMEEGPTHLVHDAAGRPVVVRRPDGTRFHSLFDGLGRPIGTREIPPAGPPRLVSLTLYGDAHPNAAARNAKGRMIAIIDGAGMVEIAGYDHMGRPVASARRYLAAPDAPHNWEALAALDPVAALGAAAALMEPEVFTTESTFDALGRPLTSTSADGTVSRSRYDIGGNLEGVDLVTPDGIVRPVVAGQTWDAQGNRLTLSLGNGTVTRYTRDAAEQRLRRQVCTRSADGQALLDIAYTYDPVGNVTGLGDASARAVYFANTVVSGDQRFDYDALYRLTRATGRELASATPEPWSEIAGAALPHANDAQAVRRYSRSYTYDLHGNITQIRHQAGLGGWTRRLSYGPASNRLLAASAPADAAGVFSLGFTHDAQGRMLTAPGLGAAEWSATGQMTALDMGGGGAARYYYGAGGGRVRKVVTRPGGLSDEWLYLGAVDVFRRRRNGVVILERTTYRVGDGDDLLCRVEAKIVDPTDPTGIGLPLMRFRHGDMTGSIAVETSATGAVIQTETFHPYGTTAYRSSVNASEVALSRYRYASRETDAESGLVMMGARMFARWIGRFVSPDPAGVVEGSNLYAYAGGNPIMRRDPGGMQSNGGDEKPKSDASTWTYAELQAKARALGRTIGAEVTAQNYREYFVDGVWHVLTPLAPDVPTAPDGGPAGPGGDGGDGAEGATGPPPTSPQSGTQQPGANGGGADGGGADAGGPASPGANGNGAAGEGDGGDATPGAGGVGNGGAAGPDGAPGANGTGPGSGDGEGKGSSVVNGGAAAVSWYSSAVRSAYAAANIERASEAVKLVEAAIANGDEAAAWAAAQTASRGRDAARLAAQERLLLAGGRGLSRLVDQGRDWSKVVSSYSRGANPGLSSWGRRAWNFFTPGLPTHTPGPRGANWGQITRDIAIGTGKTNRVMSGFSKAGKVLGPLGTIAGLGLGAYAAYDAAPQDRNRVAVEETAAFVAGAAGFALGTAATAAAIAFCVSNPVGWVVGAITIATMIGGGLAAWGASEGARSLVRWLW